MIKDNEQARFESAQSAFLRHGGVLKTSQAIAYGVHPRTLYAMRDTGVLETLDRGLYRLAELAPISNPDNVTVALKIPKGVLCLISALSYHDITTQIPHEIYLALPRGTEPPRLAYPPLRIFWFSGNAYSEGIETSTMDGAAIKVYSPEKTLADCFKYRNKIGMDTVLEALKFYRQRKKMQADKLMHYARICRVENIMRPYLEASL